MRMKWTPGTYRNCSPHTRPCEIRLLGPQVLMMICSGARAGVQFLVLQELHVVRERVRDTVGGTCPNGATFLSRGKGRADD